MSGLITALAVGCLIGSLAAGAAGGRNAETPQGHPDPTRNCQSGPDLEAALDEASGLMRQSNFPDAAAQLQPIFATGCDARASLLLAAAFEAKRDDGKAAATASLARHRMNRRCNNQICRRFIP